MFPAYARTIIAYLGASVVSAGAFVVIVGTVASCGDNEPPAIRIDVTPGAPACVTVADGSFSEARCDGGTDQ